MADRGRGRVSEGEIAHLPLRRVYCTRVALRTGIRSLKRREVDLFAEHPIDFNELWNRSEVIELTRTVVRIASIPDLIYLKRLAGRPQDLADIEALEAILRRKGRADA